MSLSVFSSFFNSSDKYKSAIAFALSKGQRASLEFLKLSTLLRVGVDSDSVMKVDFPSVGEVFKNDDGKEMKSISIYSGINRAISRKGQPDFGRLAQGSV